MVYIYIMKINGTTYNECNDVQLNHLEYCAYDFVSLIIYPCIYTRTQQLLSPVMQHQRLYY